MDFDHDEQQARLIAQHWGVSVESLELASWNLEEIEGDDGEVYGYLVRFAADSDPELLEQLGVNSKDLTRDVSAWAFDSQEPDDGIYSLDAPFPDIFISEDDEPSIPELQRGESYLTTEDGRVLTDENGNPLIAVTATTALVNDIAAAKHELLVCLALVEDTVQLYREALPPRHHNNPPGLVEDDPLSPADFETVRKAVETLRAEVGEDDPAPEVIQAQASQLRKLALSITSWIGRKLDLGVDSLIKWGVPVSAAAWAHANPDRISRALNAAADAASKLAQLLGAN